MEVTRTLVTKKKERELVVQEIPVRVNAAYHRKSKKETKEE